jgi:hypothetical protein
VPSKPFVRGLTSNLSTFAFNTARIDTNWRAVKEFDRRTLLGIAFDARRLCEGHPYFRNTQPPSRQQLICLSTTYASLDPAGGDRGLSFAPSLRD